MAVRPLEPRDVEVVLAIQAASPEIAQWSRADYERVEAGEMAGWVAERISEQGAREPVVVGFLVARNIPPEVEILNLAVVPSARHHGVGARCSTRQSTGRDRWAQRNACWKCAPQTTLRYGSTIGEIFGWSDGARATTPIPLMTLLLLTVSLK